MPGTGMAGGGFIGRSLYALLQRIFGNYGFVLVAVCLTLIGGRLLFGVSYRALMEKCTLLLAPLLRLLQSLAAWRQNRSDKAVTSAPAQPSKAPARQRPPAEEMRKEEPRIVLKSAQPKPVKSAAPVRQATSGSALPPIELLAPVPASRISIPKAVLDKQSQALTSCFADFGIQGEVQGVQPGPVITMFEFKPAPGVKVSRIANMSDDLALALKARAVRIVAPLPGRDTVGIEIPNDQRQIVYLREILDDPAFADTKAQLPLALGMDIQGVPRSPIWPRCRTCWWPAQLARASPCA